YGDGCHRDSAACRRPLECPMDGARIEFDEAEVFGLLTRWAPLATTWTTHPAIVASTQSGTDSRPRQSGPARPCRVALVGYGRIATVEAIQGSERKPRRPSSPRPVATRHRP